MKTLFGIAAVVLMATPAQATDVSAAMGQFCSAMKDLNDMGMSGAPGTPVARAVRKESGQSADSYRMVWTLAKSSKCSRIF